MRQAYRLANFRAEKARLLPHGALAEVINAGILVFMQG